MEKYFRSQTYGKCSFSEVMTHITNRIAANPDEKFLFAIGTDSQNHRKETKFANVLMLHMIGKGGIFFCLTHNDDRIRVVTTRMLEETHQSIDIAFDVVNWFEEEYKKGGFDFSAYDIKMEIHCDIGHNGASSDAIKGTLGWIQAEFGDSVLGVIKPVSAAASHLADRYTK